MIFQFISKYIFILSFACLTACATSPITKENNTKTIETTKGRDTKNVAAPKEIDPKKVEVAKQFLRNIGGGELALFGLKKSLAQQSIDQPGLAVVMSRAFKDVSSETFIDLGAEVYSRHVSYADLSELANFSKDPTIQKYFKTYFDAMKATERPDEKEFMKRFNADEITKIMKFGLSESFGRLQQVQSLINKEMEADSEKLGEKIMRDYIKTQ